MTGGPRVWLVIRQLPVFIWTVPSSVYPCPQSVIRIHLLEAENLIAKDNFMGGMIKGKSDPYVKVRLGGQKFRSRVIKEELNPRWSEIYEVRLKEACL